MKPFKPIPTCRATRRTTGTSTVAGPSPDMSTLCLNATAREIADGRPLSYNWLRRLGRRAGPLPRRSRPLDSFLKCYYTAGMLGGNEGYYQFLGPKGFSKPFLPDRSPHWIQQLTTLASVHASSRTSKNSSANGDLCSGSNKAPHSKDLPAYEFPTGDDTVRVLAHNIATAPNGSSPRGPPPARARCNCQDSWAGENSSCRPARMARSIVRHSTPTNY